MLSFFTANQRVLIDYNKRPNEFKPNEYPDGLVIDSNDFLWTALYGGGRIIRIDPRTGLKEGFQPYPYRYHQSYPTAQVVKSIDVAAPYTTSLAFGGADFGTIYVTTGEVKKDENELRDKYPKSGKLFKIEPGLKGVKAFNFRP